MFNGEADMHEARLSVGHTMDFAFRMEVPTERSRRLNTVTIKFTIKTRWIGGMKARIMKPLVSLVRSLARTHHTRVGT
ncbi:uncharacterized protein LOC62_08G009852 [Vanrija pseudolonga]|uniref:Uncharacterized protein n=1 Tax=Vanrija pseudolonga TaxID=143232 RepID=A0AAF0YGA4_9TREE|nr:hypothetical protein LOC62_08G009852 [Vanrija pseudolonga]